MRSQTLQNTVYIEYPDLITQINDRNVITVRVLSVGAVGARFTFTCNGESVTIQYESELDFLLFHINSTLKRLVNGQHQIVTVTGNVGVNGIGYDITPFTMYVEQGRTLNTRPSGCCRTMYYGNTSDLTKVQIFAPVSGSATVGQNTYTLDAGVTSLNLTEYNGSPITPPSGDFDIQVHLSYSHSETPVYFGDMWKHAAAELQSNTNYTIRMIEITSGSDCGPNTVPFGKIRFIDADGAYKTFIGKVTKEKYSLKQNEYINNDLVVNNPLSLIANVNDEVSIAFSDVAHNAYIYDIAFSTHIEYMNGYGEWRDAILADSSLTESDPETNDVEIKIKVLA